VTVADALMLALGVIAVGSGALVVTSSHLVRAGFYLVVSLGAIAGLYLVLGAELVAWVQVLVYVGAVVVLLLFAVMLTRAPIGPSRDLDRSAVPAAIIGAGVGFGLTALLVDAFRWTEFELPPHGSAQRVGEQVFGAWVLPFEVLSILLLAALIGAIVLSRPDLGARPDPAAPPAPPPPDPVDESAEVVARLERIAARQAAAQARVRQAHADALAAEAAANAPEPEPEPADPLRQQAHDVVFGAHEARPRVGEPSEAEILDSRIIPGESVVDSEQPIPPKRAIEGGERPAGPAIEGNVIEGDLVEGKGPERPALPAGDDRDDEEKER
jgi:NADH:ubiquinone oxidoreductase subunit 6 (subunit J)